MRAKVTSIGLGGATNLALMAPIKKGFANAVETITYLERLKRLLNALHASRSNLREAELDPPVFPDTIGRFGVIRQFRYAIWPRPSEGDDGSDTLTRYLTLNVSFDGGWEPYMRVIYRDIGPLLDALLCHCDGYPGSRNADFDAYCRWVRNHEMDAGIFYTDSPATAADAKYLAQMERIQRESSNPATADDSIARLALPPLKQQRQEAFARVLADPQRTLALPLRTLKGLFRLTPFFADNADHDDEVLLSFARLALKEFVELVQAVFAAATPEHAALATRLRPFLNAFADELTWVLEKIGPGALTKPADLAFNPSALQNAILNRDDPVTHGCVVMLSVRDRQRAAAQLQGLISQCGPPAFPESVRWQVAFTRAGLKELGVDPMVMDVFPPEFTEGMEARCGILGDLRGNHPNHWRRPLRYGVPADRAERIDLSTAHVVVLLRLIDLKSDAVELHPALVDLVKHLDDAQNGGLKVLAVEPTRSRRDPNGLPRPEHFGFADGLSQPQPVPPRPGPKGTDEVNAGELLLGYRNERDDGALEAHQKNPLFHNGTFLVVRKLRQRVDHLDSRMEAAFALRPDKAALMAEARAKMMGRSQTGQPLLHPAETAPGNAFNFDKDPDGRFCPFHSHIRRANPRDGRDSTPRILRRGMSYGPSAAQAGPEADRGVMFMAYCASIAEQFETIQGWIAGGNSSGLSSAQADPFLAVPRPGERRTFRYFDQQGQLQRVDLGDKPFVELQWGLYLFVPSLEGLRALAETAALPAQPQQPQTTTWAPWVAEGDTESWREQLEVQDRSPAVWASVREQPGGRAVADGYGTLIGDLAGAKEVLQDFTASRYSVAGYADRMGATIGVNLLGLDPTDPLRAPQADAVNAVIEKVSEDDAFAATWPLVMGVMGGFTLLDQPPGLPPGDERIRRPIDLISLSENVLARLCTHWFGLPENPATLPAGEAPFMIIGGRTEGRRVGVGTPRCPGELLSSSRTVFASHPNNMARDRGAIEGPRVLDAVRKYLQSNRHRPALTVEIVTALTQKLSALPAEEMQNIVELNLAGMLLGFPPTVHGNFLQTMKTWIEDGTLWDHQQALAEAAAAALALARQQAQADGRTPPQQLTPAQICACAHDAMRPRLMATMRRCPVPEALWRSPVDKAGTVDKTEGNRVVVGIRSALAGLADDPDAAKGHYDELMFGGSRSAKSHLHALHACPGYHMGVGVLLALLTGVLLAGALQATGSPVLLMLTPKAPPA